MSFKGYNYNNISTLVKHVGFSKDVKSVNSKNGMTSRFCEIKEKILIANRNLFQLRFHNTDVKDIVNTISIIMSTETYCHFGRWRIGKDRISYTLTMPTDDYRRIQKGFSAELLSLRNQHKLRNYKKNPKYPWVFRCLTDLDDVIYSKGVRCLYFALTNKIQDSMHSYLIIKRWKSLSTLLAHIRRWRSVALDMDSGFMRGLITFLSSSKDKQVIFVSKKACQYMHNNFGCPFELPENRDKFHVVVQKGDDLTMNLFYDWLITRPPEEALNIFCNVYNDIPYKVSKKRKKTSLVSDNNLDNEVILYYKNVTCQGNPQAITMLNHLKSHSLLDLVYIIYHLKETTTWEKIHKEELYHVMCNIVRNGVAGKFTPIATTNKIGEPHKCHRQNDIFPIINLPKIIAEKLNKISIDYTKIF